jgi:hypothetical protein
MYLHLGGEVIIQKKDLIAVIDIEKNNSKITKEFIKIAEEEGFLRKIGEDKPKTMIITEIKNKSMIFLSSISSATLYKRSEFLNNM